MPVRLPMYALLLIDLAATANLAATPDALIVAADAASLGGHALHAVSARTTTFVDLGPIEHDRFESDLAWAVRAPIAGIFLPRCGEGADIQRLAAKLAVAEAEAARQDGSLAIIAAVAGTPAATLKIGSLVGASDRLAALVFDDVRLGLALRRGSAAYTMARALTIVTAAAADVPAFDRLSDGKAGVQCADARRDGFAGMLTSDIDALATIDAAFAIIRAVV